ncbi:hypothetical protein SSX86_029110 [Deinandra increscens subsp. villosa]|uniref:Mitochondrial import inner membrane translocase subunit TIM50 n=1 Tax=Deinandra increscens subsp. villosa TaxID=3103831 RepID=A0AAP0C9E4_9ASTR
MGNVKSIWSKREESPKNANGETSSSTNSTFDVKTVSEEVGKTEKANGEASIKKKRKKRKNKKLATGVILNPHNNVKDTEIANCGQQDTPSSDVKSLMSEETVSDIIYVRKTISEEVGKTERANGEASRKKKREKRKNKKQATGVILNPHNNVADTKIANCGQQDTPSSDVKISMSEETVSEIFHVKTVSEEVGKVEKANGEASTKKKRKKTKNKKLATSVILNPHNNIEDTEIANRGQQDTPSSEELRVQSQVNDGQRIETNIIRSLSENLTIGNVENPNNKNFVTRSKKMLLILDVNGLLVEVIHPPPKDCTPDIKISKRAIFKRPYLDDFLEFCFERFDVAIWSSRTRKILDPVVDYLLGDLKKKLVFLWDSSHCTNSSARCLENYHKFIVFKKLGKIWEENGLNASEHGYYDESNTLLLDDSPYKALLNPKHTGIFPFSYRHNDTNDNSLGPDGDLRIYLEGVAASGNVKTYLEQHPFGQRAIDETSPNWAFYSKAVKNVF